MDKKVLITGGAGYLGSVITEHFLNKGYDVTCLDNLQFHQKSLFPFAVNPKFNFIYGDVRDKNLLEKVVSDFDIIFPLAAIVGMPASKLKPKETQETNFDSIAHLDEIRRPEQKLVYPTTNSGYGTKSGETFCTEETPLEPISEYGKTKVESEKLLLNSDKDAITLRLATVFGTSPRMRRDLLVNDFVYKALTDRSVVMYEKDAKRNYIHIRDVARVFEHCVRNYDSMKNEPYNVGLEDANLSKEELALKIKEHVPDFAIIPMEIGEDPDKRDYVISNQKILSTGFKPKYSLDFGIKELIKGYDILLRNDPYKNI